MQNKNFWILIIILCFMIMFFGNKKVRLWVLLKEQINIFTNAKKNKISLWDCICFFVIPLIISIIIIYKLDFIIKKELAELLSTVFSIIFTVLFGFATIMISKIESKNKLESQVAKETFITIVSSTVLSLIIAVLSIFLTQIQTNNIVEILSMFTLVLSQIIIMLLLLITKRTFLLYIKYNN